MIFSDLYKSPKSPLSKLRHANPVGLDARNAGYDADLLSKDKTRQKEAIKRVLTQTVRNDWDFQWPRPAAPGRPATNKISSAPASGSAPQAPPAAETSGLGAPADTTDVDSAPPARQLSIDTADEEELESDGDVDSDAESVYSCVSEDPTHYQPRLEWASDLSDDESPIASSSPFRFNNPDSVGAAVRASAAAKQAQRRRAQRAEAEWNDGLACFNARRDAWTGARTVRVKPKPASPTSPTSPRRSLWRLGSSKSDVGAPPPPDSAVGSASASPPSNGPAQPRNSQQSQPGSFAHSNGSSSSTSLPPTRNANPAYPVKTLIPVPRPLLPIGNPMRASISPAMYTSLYDKVVVASLQPSCPINLADMIRSCVVGWKRDGEWPPRPMELPAAALVVVRKKKDDKRESTKDRRGSAATQGSGAGRRLSLGGLLGRAAADDKDKDKEAKKEGSGSGEGGSNKSFRRSIQRVLGFGHGHSPSSSGVQPKEPTAA